MEERHKLQEDRHTAVLNRDEDEIARIDTELQDIEDKLKGTKARAETQMQRFARINAENRKRNMAEIRRAEIAEKRAAREALMRAEKEGGNFVANPFARVKTSVKFHHNMGDSPKNVTVGASPPKEGKTEAPIEVPVIGKGRRKGGVDDVIASMDLGIEIDI